MDGTAASGLHLRRYGQGAEMALLLHCALSRGSAWTALAGELADRLTMLAPDLTGHGRSPDWDGKTDLHSVMRDGAAALLTEPMHLIGHSMGATIALRLAAERPEMVRSLTMIEPVFFAVAIADNPAVGDQLAAEIAPVYAALGTGDTETAAQRFSAIWGGGESWQQIPAQQRAYLAQRIHLIPAGDDAIAGDNAGILTPAALSRITMPVLLVEGTASPPVIHAVQSGLAARLPQSRRVVVAGAGHMVPQTHPVPVAAEISRMIGKGKATAH